jgi:hypothetical protein
MSWRTLAGCDWHAARPSNFVDICLRFFFISKAFDETQRLKPPFYLEGDSLLWGTWKSKYYALCSKYPLFTYSDHIPLNWTHKTERDPIKKQLHHREAV